MGENELHNWIAQLYKECDKSIIEEAEENFRDFILFLFHSSIHKTVDTDILTDKKSQDNVEA